MKNRRCILIPCLFLPLPPPLAFKSIEINRFFLDPPFTKSKYLRRGLHNSIELPFLTISFTSRLAIPRLIIQNLESLIYLKKNADFYFNISLSKENEKENEVIYASTFIPRKDGTIWINDNNRSRMERCE